MSGVTIEVDVQGLQRVQQALGKAQRALTSGLREVLEDVAAEVEDQTRRRLTEDKRGPDGQPWAAWSVAHAATRHGGHSLLEGEGDLVDSIQSAVEGDTVVVGSNLTYAAIHQMGGAGAGKPELPARPYLGVSTADEDDIVQVVQAGLARILEVR